MEQRLGAISRQMKRLAVVFLLTICSLQISSAEKKLTKAELAERAHTRAVCKKLEAINLSKVKLKEIKGKPLKFPTSAGVPDLSVKSEMVFRTENLSKKCVIDGEAPVVYKVLGTFKDKTYSYQLCSTPEAKPSAGTIGAVFETITDTKSQVVFKLSAGEEEEAKQFEAPEFSLNRDSALLKITLNQPHWPESVYYILKDSKWIKLDSSYWANIIDQIIPKDQETNSFLNIDLKTLKGEMRAGNMKGTEWKWATEYEKLTVDLVVRNDRFEPVKISCKAIHEQE
jgi:hypothetical protein